MPQRKLLDYTLFLAIFLSTCLLAYLLQVRQELKRTTRQASPDHTGPTIITAPEGAKTGRYDKNDPCFKYYYAPSAHSACYQE